LYDPCCDHLLRELDNGEVVGTYRILPPDAAKRVGSHPPNRNSNSTG